MCQTRHPSPAGSDALVQRWTDADHAARRALIVDTALALLDEAGLKAVTMRRVADQLGVGAMTLYTYLAGQEELHREMVRCGFEMLHEGCKASSTLGTSEGWRGGARAYLHFALDHPNLYKLMFDTPDADGDLELLQGGFEPLLEKVREHLAAEGLEGEVLHRRARAAAGRYWIALHGLATLAIAGRLALLEGDADAILDDMLPRIVPTM